VFKRDITTKTSYSKMEATLLSQHDFIIEKSPEVIASEKRWAEATPIQRSREALYNAIHRGLERATYLEARQTIDEAELHLIEDLAFDWGLYENKKGMIQSIKVDLHGETFEVSVKRLRK
jgi:hypothetical protein